ncbi:31662_t:CDS:2 [Racocetra persica]|uniref:31662_t:CDS:1 n=1 Tax=Racocetra persica TaxID=160502 RepID=A0ACA9NZZ9_9GLOM|nr:31662_t:CDS:2 [Racocetra persica]
MESENLIGEEDIDIRKRFIKADSIIKKTSLKSLSTFQNKYYSTLIDVKEITKSLKVPTQINYSNLDQLGSSLLELPPNISNLIEDSEASASQKD